MAHIDRIFRDPVGDWMIDTAGFYRRQGPQDPVTGCIPWAGVFNNIGYPFIGVRDAHTDRYKMVTAHRVALTLKLGRAIRPGMNANHTCHNRWCVAQAHLEEGTQQQKIADMVRDGVKTGCPTGPRGAYNHKQHGREYKYTEADIQWVRTAAPADIAQRYGVTLKRAYCMKSAFRQGYQWLPVPPLVKHKRKRAKR